MVEYLQLLWRGAVSGFAYALIGMALVLVYKTARVLNFAAGTMSGIGGFLVYAAATGHGMPFGVAVVIALIVVAGGTLAVERLTIRPLLKTGFLPIVIVTLGIDSVLANISIRAWGGSAKRMPVPFGLDRKNFDLHGVLVNAWHVVIAASTLVILAVVGYVVNRTNLGLAMRAFAEDQDAARLMGIREATVSRATWVLSATIGAVTGILFAPVLFLQQGYMNPIFIKGFVAAILGGFTSLGGSVGGGLLLGVLEAGAVKWAPRQVATALPVIIVFVIMLTRPRGLFTRATAHERV